MKHAFLAPPRRAQGAPRALLRLAALACGVASGCAEPSALDSVDTRELGSAPSLESGPSAPEGSSAAAIATAMRAAGPRFAFASVGAAHRLRHPSMPLTAIVGARGFAVEDRARAFSLELRVADLGREGAPVEEGLAAPPRVADNAARWERGAGVEETWRAGPPGFEQEILVPSRPPGAGPLRVLVEIDLDDDSRLEVRPSGVIVRGADERVALRIGALYAFDRAGRELPIEFAADPRGVSYVVDDADAEYPLLIDPLLFTDVAALRPPAALGGEGFGASVALAGDTLAVGAPDAAVLGEAEAGQVAVFVRDGAGTWTEQQVLTAGTPVAGDRFGHAVTLDGDRLYVGAPFDDDAAPDAGSVTVFTRAADVWTESSVVLPISPSMAENFGWSIVSQDPTLVIGAPGRPVGAPGVGAAFAYARSDATYTLRQLLIAPVRAADDRFGTSLAMDDSTLMIGAPGGDTGAMDAGEAHVFTRRADGVIVIQRTLRADAPVDGERLGTSVAVWGDLVAAGAPGVDADAATLDSGAAYAFLRAPDASWSQVGRVTEATPGADARFGAAVALRGRALVVGAPGSPGGGVATGAAPTFLFDGAGLSPDLVLSGSDPQPGDAFGASLSLRAESVAVGSPGDDEGAAVDVGSAFVGRLQLTDGEPCGGAVDCASGFCTDGVCCPVACGGGAVDCQACAMAAGSSADGVCETLALDAECRPSLGACDPAELCDGVAIECPDDARDSVSECRPSLGVCDPAETCDGVDPACPPDALDSTTVCNAASDDCDAEEVCDGLNPECPADALRPAGAECRASTDLCDAAEVCDGMSAACPDDELSPMGAECRPAAGGCDAPEVCDGSAAECPADVVSVAGTPCRPAAGACDVAETCDGLGGACPDDVLVSAGTSCRASTGACDIGERCTGTSGACPMDRTLPNGTSCEDGARCTMGSVCLSGRCERSTPVDCDDGDPCTADACAEETGCSNTPIEGCVPPRPDAGPDAGERDAGSIDPDAGEVGGDAGLPDAGARDAGSEPRDASADRDAARSDAGPVEPPAGGCSCRATAQGSRQPTGFAGLLVAVVFWRRRRADRGADAR